MPRIKIIGLPKAGFGMQVSTTTTQGPEVEKERDINGCIIGEETYDILTGICQPIDSGYDPTQDKIKGTPIVGTTNPAGEHVGGTGAKETPNHFHRDDNNNSQTCPQGYHKDSKGKCVKDRIGIEMLKSMFRLGTGFAKNKENKENEDFFKTQFRNKMFTGPVTQGKDMGFHEINTGVFKPNMMAPVNEGMGSNFIGQTIGQFGGSFESGRVPSTIKIKILDGPDPQMMKYGGQSNYGFDSGWKRSFTEMNSTSSDHYTNSMSEDKNTDEKPVLEAEGGETLYKPGDETFFNLNGPKHSKGGIALTASQVNSDKKNLASFIYSDTPSLKIKDKKILEHFNVPYKRGGVTPAEISKKYDINKFTAIIADPNSDNLSKATAQLVKDRNERYLAELATVQESMKGKNPPDFAAQKLGSAKYGGPFLPTYDVGGPGPNAILGDFSDDFETLQKRLKAKENEELRHEIYNRYKSKNPSTTVTEDAYIDNLLEAQRQIYALQNAHKNDPDFLNSADWDKVKNNMKNKMYTQEMNKLGITPLSGENIKQFQQAYRDLEDAMADTKFFDTFGKYFKTTPKGNIDQQYRGKPISPVDEIFGNTTNRQFLQLSDWKEPIKPFIPPPEKRIPGEDPKPKYICNPITKQPMETNGSYGYDSVEEAMKNCGSKSVKKPFDFLQPDKFNMAAHAAIPPRQIFPYIPDMPFNPKQVALEDWKAPAAAAFSIQYAAPAAELDAYGPIQGATANKAFLASKAAENITGNIIPGVTSRNVNTWNQFMNQEAAREDKVMDYNTLAKQKRWEGYATTKQNYDNAMRQYLKENSDAFTRAWKNRMHLGHINATNPDFIVDPRSGQQIWIGTDIKNVKDLPFYSGSGSTRKDFMNEYSSAYDEAMASLKDKSYMTDKEKDAEARKIAQEYMRSTRTVETSNPYKNSKTVRDYGFDFE